MHRRRTVLLAPACALVALTGCGSSSLLDGSSASDLQQSLSSVSQAIDDGQCSQARSAARSGAQRVDELPTSVDAALRKRLKTGFEELASRVASDCKDAQTTTDAPVTTAPETTTDEAPPVQTETEPAPDTTTNDVPATPTTPDDGTDTSGGDGTTTDDDSGGVAPGVDGPAAVQRGIDRLKQQGRKLRDDAERALRKGIEGKGGG